MAVSDNARPRLEWPEHLVASGGSGPVQAVKPPERNSLATAFRRLRGAHEAELFGPRGRLPRRGEPDTSPNTARSRPRRADPRGTGAAPGRAARDLARRGDQHPPGAPLAARPVPQPVLRRPPAAPLPPGAVADDPRVRRRRIRRPAPLADRRDARDPGALRAGTRAVRPSHRPDRGRVRRRLPAAHLVLARGADVRARGAVRAARSADAAASDPQRHDAQLGGLHPRHRRAALVALLRPAPDRVCSSSCSSASSSTANAAANPSGRWRWASPTRPPCS